ncbi:conserved hypothetical protein [Neospora caninum Liverpool]|uniref:Uncharacterized protein n=1 Tax=Neospora caninum (strain Liverpool) TaxID=572307 RepID=F0VN80_NEOCL|nr:conserved hypothetical protein [Neospora caninum Liverpool]CBZ55176.1 conserved hypothetical protein [Neospora caninum Liverpool]|eukprot:XP_003885204.1 conserved hypothetical protein [Neospora caninum Liverpool]
MGTDSLSFLQITGIQKFFSDIRTACREAVAVNQVLQMLVEEMNSGGELMTMDQLKAAADYGKDIRPQAAGLATGSGAALAIKASGVFKNGPIWKPAAVVLRTLKEFETAVRREGFCATMFSQDVPCVNVEFTGQCVTHVAVRIAMADGDSKLSRQLRSAYKKAAPPGSTTLENL